MRIIKYQIVQMSSQYGVIETDFGAYCITKNSTNLQTNSPCHPARLQLCEMMP